jgi:hypothetical protein
MLLDEAIVATQDQNTDFSSRSDAMSLEPK